MTRNIYKIIDSAILLVKHTELSFPEVAEILNNLYDNIEIVDYSDNNIRFKTLSKWQTIIKIENKHE